MISAGLGSVGPGPVLGPDWLKLEDAIKRVKVEYDGGPKWLGNDSHSYSDMSQNINEHQSNII